MTSEISVVIPTFQRGAQLPLLLSSLAEQTLSSDRFEVVVVDDCSTDDTTEIVERLAGSMPYQLRVLRTPVNDGPAAARNLGWKSAASAVVAFIDDDCIPSPGWLEHGLAAISSEPGIGVVQGRTTAPEGTDVTTLRGWYLWRIIEGPTAYFEGCNLFFPRQVLETTGGFNEEIRYYGEDCAAGWSVLEAGFGRAFSSEAAVEHELQQRGFRWYVKNGYLESRLVHCAAKHPGFRQAGFWRPWAIRRADAALAVAVVGGLLGLRFRPALVLVLPYVWWQRPSVRHPSFFRLCVQKPVLDAARVAGHLRGSVAHGIFVL